MSDPRHTVDTITSDQLDALYDRLERAEQDAVAYAAADSADAAAGSYAGHAEQAEAAIARVRALAAELAQGCSWTGSEPYAAERILAALDEPKEATTAVEPGPAEQCTAQNRSDILWRRCIMPARHIEHHADGTGLRWTDDVATYPEEPTP